jgi:hypothetical protein
LWGVGLRLAPTAQATEAGVEQALADRSLVRAWPMRSTIHFLAAEDARWVLALLAPRQRMLIDNMARYARVKFDETIYARSQAVFAQALRGGRHLTRPELAEALEQAGIDAQGQFNLLQRRAMADGQLVYGLRRGKTLTHVLLDEWVPPGPVLPREAALAELVRRYFTSHGPALVEDFAWWSGLTRSDTRLGLELSRPHLGRSAVNGREYWHAPEPAPAAARADGPAAHLLPPYDEYTIAYRERGDFYDPAQAAHLGNTYAFWSTICVDGRVVGMWRRTLKKGVVVVETAFFAPLSRAKTRAVAAAAERYAGFLGLKLELRG